MGRDEVPGGEGGAKGEFSSQDTRCDDASQLTRVVAGAGLVCAADAEEVEHGALGLEDSASADGADFD